MKQFIGGSLLRPEELTELYLKTENPELSLKAFDVFAFTSSSFCKSHKKLLKECWKNAANQDDLAQLHQAYLAEGWSNEETLQQLRDTVLLRASRRCYGPEANDEVSPEARKCGRLIHRNDFDAAQGFYIC